MGVARFTRRKKREGAILWKANTFQNAVTAANQQPSSSLTAMSQIFPVNLAHQVGAQKEHSLLKNISTGQSHSGEKMVCSDNGGCTTCSGREGENFCQPGNQVCPAEGLKRKTKCDICGSPAAEGFEDANGMPHWTCGVCIIHDDTGTMIPITPDE